MNKRYLPVGNEFISIPQLCEDSAAIEDITFLHMAAKGLIDLRGGERRPLIAPFVRRGGETLYPEAPSWRRLSHWIPTFTWQTEGIQMEGVILPPLGERGFVYQLTLTNPTGAAQQLTFGLEGFWAAAWHCVNEDKEIDGTKHAYRSGWNDSVVFDLRCGLPLFAFAPMTDLPCETAFCAQDGGVAYSLSRTLVLQPGAAETVNFYWGFGFEEVAAATSAKEMLRRGFEPLRRMTLDGLKRRMSSFADPAIDALYNTNLFFCIFFSTGVTLDSEEPVMVTSRSPRYYVSAAYWDRDSLLWSFPAILGADPDLARQMLLYAFGRQGRNIGVHSRYIDGTVLEPGFELDELMAPVLALARYVEKTGDTAILALACIRSGVDDILRKLAARRHGEIALYSTFLQPTDDEIVHPYLTYDNVLVWKALRAIAALYPEKQHLEGVAEETRQAILTHCIKARDGARFFAWSVDLAGNFDIYDEPPGSLLLLPYLGFCTAEDEVYRNTAAMIRSADYAYSFAGCAFSDIGCPHAPHPWLLSVANSLLSGRVEESLDLLRRAEMDNGIVCESIDEHTGACATGQAFATCAGFVCHALKTAAEEM